MAIQHFFGLRGADKQWGIANTYVNHVCTVPFPVSFSESPFNAIVSDSADDVAGMINHSVKFLTAATISVLQSSNGGAADGTFYIAIGH